MEKLLKISLPSHYGISSDNVTVPFYKRAEPFTEVDDKACEEAHNKFIKDGSFAKYTYLCSNCDKVVLPVDNNGKEITVIQFEKYIHKYFKKVLEGKKRCDLLMTDEEHNKIVFCDLCCYDEQYILGKRAMAYKQMEASVKMLLGIPFLETYILGHPKKECLFASRSYIGKHPTMAIRGNAEANMQAMITTVSSVSEQIVSENTIMEHNFRFVQNKYPNVYKW